MAKSLGWIVQSKSPWQSMNRYPENAESGLVESLCKVMGFSEVIFLHEKFHELTADDLHPQMGTIAWMFNQAGIRTSCSNHARNLDAVFGGHLTAYYDKNENLLKQIVDLGLPFYYADVDGELFRGEIEGSASFIYMPLIKDYQGLEAVFSTVIVPDYLQKGRNEFKKFEYVPLCPPSYLENNLIAPSTHEQFLGRMRMYDGAMSGVFQHSTHLKDPSIESQGRGWFPPLLELVEKISEFKYLMPSGYMFQAHEVRVTQKIWEASVSGTSAVQFAKTKDVFLEHWPDYPSELIFTPETNPEEFVEVLKSEFIRVPESVTSHFSSVEVRKALGAMSL